MYSLHEALFAYAQPDLWRKIQQNGMKEDNSWQNAARKYAALYQMIK
jgi:glycogen synthase